MAFEPQTLVTMALAIVLVPLLGAITQIFVGRKLPKGGDWLAQACIVTSAILSITLFVKLVAGPWDPNFAFHSVDHGLSWTWIKLFDVDITVGILFDNLSVTMLAMVTIIASCIFFFSAGYMKGDRYYSRFFAYLCYFCFAMLGLIVVDNLLFLFVFWELVGVGSYLLIGFFFYEETPPIAAMKAFMTNRVGDVLFMLGLVLAWQLTGTLSYREMFEVIASGAFPVAETAGGLETHAVYTWLGLTNHGMLTLSGILIFCGAISKSAQVPLHVWLPDAMAGPTPVSALIHAATMVAAGVFMVGRMYPFFTPDALAFIAGIGALTALVGATMGIVMWDIKKVLAYSTMSQLGYMMLALGVGGYTAGLFHLVTHAFFKACLFLGSGSVIHAVHSQDMRDMGGLKKKMPVTYWTFLIATLALAGVPCFAGYYSKDQIVATAMAWGMTHGAAAWTPFVFAAVGAFMTTFYMFRLIFLTFHGKPADEHKYSHAHESPAVMALPLVILAAFAIFAGGSINPLPHIEHLWFNELMPTPASAAAAGLGLDLHLDHFEHNVHAAHYPALVVSLLAIIIGFFMARAFYLKKSADAEAWRQRFGPVHTVVSNKYYFDEFYNGVIIGGLHKLNRSLYWFDRNIIDRIVNTVGLTVRFVAFIAGLFDKYVIDGLVNFWRWFTQSLSSIFRLIQTGNAQSYLTWTLVGVLVLAFVLAGN